MEKTHSLTHELFISKGGGPNLNGGALLHIIKWAKKGTYRERAKQYVSYVRSIYGHCCIVFDGGYIHKS